MLYVDPTVLKALRVVEVGLLHIELCNASMSAARKKALGYANGCPFQPKPVCLIPKLPGSEDSFWRLAMVWNLVLRVGEWIQEFVVSCCL